MPSKGRASAPALARSVPALGPGTAPSVTVVGPVASDDQRRRRYAASCDHADDGGGAGGGLRQNGSAGVELADGGAVARCRNQFVVQQLNRHLAGISGLDQHSVKLMDVGSGVTSCGAKKP